MSKEPSKDRWRLQHPLQETPDITRNDAAAHLQEVYAIHSVRMKGSKGRSSDVANVILPSIGIRSRHVTGKGSNGKVRAVLVFFLESYK